MENVGFRCKTRVFVLGASLCMTLLAGCGSTDTAPIAKSDIFRDAETIPLVVTEALSVSAQLHSGLSIQALSALDTYTIQANDLRGEPFVNITFTAPEEIGNDPWAFAEQLTGNEWAGYKDGSPWTATITGATKVRSILVTANVGLDELINLDKTVKAMGGPANIKEVVALEAEVFLLRDQSGYLWDTETATRFTKEQEATLKAEYDEVYEANNTPEHKAFMEAAWNEMLGQGQLSTQGVSLQSFAKADGSLDPLRLQAAWENASLTPQIRNPKTKECPFFCWEVETGYIRPDRQALITGYSQLPENFGRRGELWKMIGCIANGPASDVKINAIGCAPAAFTGMIMRKYLQGFPAFGTKQGTATQLSLDEFKQRISAPTGLRGRPLIANFMGTCWTGNGSLTLGKGFADGARNFLAQYSTSLHSDSNFSHAPGNVTSAPTKARILVQQIGTNNNEVVAEYFRGPFKGHFSPITEYKIFYGATVGVSVKTMDDRTKYYSLSETGGTERGVFWLY